MGPYEGACSARCVSEVIVATDDERIGHLARGFGARCVMVTGPVANGSERVAAAVRDRDADLVVNLQADEPLINGEVIDAAIEALCADPGGGGVHRGRPAAGLDRFGRSKRGEGGRGPTIPGPLFLPGADSVHRAGGRCAAACGALRLPPECPRGVRSVGPHPLELSEGLEQLRILETGGSMLRQELLMAVNSPADLPLVEVQMRRGSILARGRHAPGFERQVGLNPSKPPSR